jgi:hypothetical protein
MHTTSCDGLLAFNSRFTQETRVCNVEDAAAGSGRRIVYAAPPRVTRYDMVILSTK